jgi:hypothetical protein
MLSLARKNMKSGLCKAENPYDLDVHFPMSVAEFCRILRGMAFKRITLRINLMPKGREHPSLYKDLPALTAIYLLFTST